MDYFLRRERLRLAKDLINQRIIEQWVIQLLFIYFNLLFIIRAIDLERQCEDDLRREFQSIIYDIQVYYLIVTFEKLNLIDHVEQF